MERVISLQALRFISPPLLHTPEYSVVVRPKSCCNEGYCSNKTKGKVVEGGGGWVCQLHYIRMRSEKKNKDKAFFSFGDFLSGQVQLIDVMERYITKGEKVYSQHLRIRHDCHTLIIPQFYKYRTLLFEKIIKKALHNAKRNLESFFFPSPLYLQKH